MVGLRIEAAVRKAALRILLVVGRHFVDRKGLHALLRIYSPIMLASWFETQFGVERRGGIVEGRGERLTRTAP